MEIEAYQIKIIYFRIATEKKFPSSGYKIEGVSKSGRVKWELNQKLEKSKDGNFTSYIQLTGKIKAPPIGSITTRAFAPAISYFDFEEGTDKILILDKDEIVKSVVYFDKNGNIEKTEGDIDVDTYELI